MMLKHFRELYNYRSMLYNLVKRDLRGRYKGSILGFLWNFILPLTQIIVYIAVFTIVFRQNLEDYYIYLIVGMIPWTLFSESLSAGSGSVIDNAPLVSKIYFPRTIIPLSVILSKLVTFAISMTIVLTVIAVSGHGFEPFALATLPIALIILLMFTVGATMFFAALDVYMRDIQYTVTVVLMVFIWLTPIMYSKAFIDNDLFQTILSLNPLTHLIGLFQDILYWGELPSLGAWMLSLVIASVMLIVGYLVFNRLSKDFAEVI